MYAYNCSVRRTWPIEEVNTNAGIKLAINVSDGNLSRRQGFAFPETYIALITDLRNVLLQTLIPNTVSLH